MAQPVERLARQPGLLERALEAMSYDRPGERRAVLPAEDEPPLLTLPHRPGPEALFVLLRAVRSECFYYRQRQRHRAP